MALLARLTPGGRERQWAHALRGVPLLREVPAVDLVAIWRSLREVRAAAGTVLFERGASGEAFYVIQQGALEVRMGLGPAGVVVRRLGPGDFVGEMSLLTGAPRSADVVVVEDALLWVLDRRDFADLLDRRTSLVRAMNRALCERVAQVTAQLEEYALSGAAGPAGIRFGPYRVVAQIGAGGMAAVYSAVHEDTQTAVALKVLPAGWGEAPELRQRLEDEAAALQRISHPGVIRVYDVGAVESRLGGGIYLALEWIPHALDRVLRAQYPEPLTPISALRIAHGVAEALAAVHRAGLVHRDVKPSNILLRADGLPVLSDLGLAAAVHGAAGRRLTPTNVILGTADYISPEGISSGEVDGRSDLYSLGVVLYEMLAGYPPFAGRAPMDTLRAKLEEPSPPPPAAVPDAARAIVLRALERKPGDRFQDATVMARALAEAMA